MRARLQDGGGIHAYYGVMTLQNCSISNNAAADVRTHAWATSPFALGLGVPQRPAPGCTCKQLACASALIAAAPCVGACRTLRLCAMLRAVPSACVAC